jgi:GTP-binding protein EngB required for normal cell division
MQPTLTTSIISMAGGMAERFSFDDLRPLLAAIRSQTGKSELNLAVFGRFKAGKSSFLNSLLGRPVLPVGVTPLTAAVTEIAWSAEPRAEVTVAENSAANIIPFESAGNYISGEALPSNSNQSLLVRVLLPEMARFHGLRFVDTPGLESIFSNNTEAAISWSPNVDLALVAISVDSPLTGQDITLIEKLLRFTPNVSVLLTKMDILDASGQSEVLAFVRIRLRERFSQEIRVFPYSIRPGFEELRHDFQVQYLRVAIARFRSNQDEALKQKLAALLDSLAEYLRLANAVALARAQDRSALFEQAITSPKEHNDLTLNLQLIARHACANARSCIERNVLGNRSAELSRNLRAALDEMQPAWRGGLAKLLSQFESWLRNALVREMSLISVERRDDFLQPLRDAERQFAAVLQQWRDQFSQRVERLYGAPLRTTQHSIQINPPHAPNVSIGRVFDHNWELLSALFPTGLLRPLLLRRFAARLDAEIEKNLSRLTAQWEEIVHAAVRRSLREYEAGFGDLRRSVEALLSSDSACAANEIQAARAQVENAKRQLTSCEASSRADSDAQPPSIL